MKATSAAISLVMLSSLWLHSCSLKPYYSQPETAVPESYRFAPAEIEAYVNLPWWEQFEDPVLNELIQIALHNNQDIHVATATVLQFYAQYQEAFSQLFPQVNAQANAERSKLGTQVPPVSSLYELFGNLTYELDFWGSIRNQTEAAHAQFLAQVSSRSNVILSIISALAKSYILLLQYDNQLAIAKDVLQSRTAMWEIAQKRYRVGLISGMDLKQAESQVEDAEAQIKDYERTIPIQEDLLSILMGQAPGPIARGKLLETLRLPPSIPVGLPGDLLQHRPDILQAEQTLIASNASIGVARASFFPKFTLTGTDGQQSALLHDLLKSISNYFDLELNAIQSLYTGGQLRAQLQVAEAQFLENYHTYQQTVLTALQEVSDALISHKIYKEKLTILLKEESALQEYLRLSTLRYFNGQNDYLTVTVAQQDCFTVRLNVETTRGSVFSSLVDLFISLGQGWDVEADYCSKCSDPFPLWEALIPLQ